MPESVSESVSQSVDKSVKSALETLKRAVNALRGFFDKICSKIVMLHIIVDLIAFNIQKRAFVKFIHPVEIVFLFLQ